MCKLNNNKQASGFTLFEVLIALLIFSILLSAAVVSGTAAIKNIDRIKRKVLAAQIADHYISNLHIRNQWSGIAVYPQVQVYAGYDWVIKEVFESTDNSNARKVKILVFEGNKLPDSQTTNIFVLETYLRKAK